MARTLQQIRDSLNPDYAPEQALVQQQIAALPGQQTADVAGLNTAKTNAFRDITNDAVSRGALYSGVPIEGENRYVGEKFLPALAATKADYANRGTALQRELLQIGREQGDKAYSIQQGEQAAESKAAEQAYKRQLDERKFQQSLQLANTKASKPSAADSKTAVNRSLNSDLASAFSNFASRPKYFTEQTIIPALVAAYPEIDQQQLIKTAYAYRKALGYG